jgi:hypothetical protein
VSPDDIIKAFIEILKIVAWPALLLWLVWYLRDEVKRVATRITELGLTGAKFAPPPPEQVSSRPQEGNDNVTRVIPLARYRYWILETAARLGSPLEP